MEYIDNLITRAVYKCLSASPSYGIIDSVEGGTADSTEITADSTIITVDQE